jgi:hypothetical protein
MIADYFTKPLQGMIFRQLRDMIMGNTDIALPTEQARVTTRMHAARYVHQRPCSTPGCATRILPLTTTRGNVR